MKSSSTQQPSLQVPYFRPSITEAEIEEVVACLRSGWLTTGPRTKQFETDFAGRVGGKHAVAVNSCTAALHLAVEALGLGPGQAVLVPTMTFAATAEVVRYQNAVPLLVDCDPATLNLDLDDAARKIDQLRAGKTPLEPSLRVVGIIPVHVGGLMMDMDEVQAFAAERGLWLIEDAAHAFPAAYQKSEGRGQRSEVRGQRSGGATNLPSPIGRGAGGEGDKDQDQSALTLTLSGHHKVVGERGPDKNPKSPIPNSQSLIPNPSSWRRCGENTAAVSCFSFYANKTMTTGEGGMAVTDDGRLAARMRQMSLHGLSHDAWKRFAGNNPWDYKIVAPGYKYNMTDVAAAIGLHQLVRAEPMRQERERLARTYRELLADVQEIELPPDPPDRLHSWHLFPIRLRLDRLSIDRNGFIVKLREEGVGCSVHWRPLHLHPYYEETFGWLPEHLPTASAEWPRLISLPLFPGMSAAEHGRTADVVRDICRHYSA